MFGLGLQRSFGRNILELLVYYLMPNKCKTLKDIQCSCFPICTSSFYDNKGQILSHEFESTTLRKKIIIMRNIDS